MGRFDERHCRIVKAEILNKKTQPPKEYSIDTLLSFMENPRGEDGEKLAGLGTPATRAEIIKKLFAREYVFDKGKKLCASDKGLFLLKQLQKDAALAKIADVSQTTEWEAQLDKDPAAFEASAVVFIRAVYQTGGEAGSISEGGYREMPGMRAGAFGKPEEFLLFGVQGGKALRVCHLEGDKRRENHGCRCAVVACQKADRGEEMRVESGQEFQREVLP